jgi:phosphoribosylformylglycinamidine (FGAM) synthase-like enzyme
VLAAVAEMLIGGAGAATIGAAIDGISEWSALFTEEPSRYVLEVSPDHLADVQQVAASLEGVESRAIGRLDASGVLRVGRESLDVARLAMVWRAPLDW